MTEDEAVEVTDKIAKALRGVPIEDQVTILEGIYDAICIFTGRPRMEWPE